MIPNCVSNGGRFIFPISDWLVAKKWRGILKFRLEIDRIVVNRGTFLQNRDLWGFLLSRSGEREWCLKSGKSRQNRESWQLCK